MRLVQLVRLMSLEGFGFLRPGTGSGTAGGKPMAFADAP